MKRRLSEKLVIVINGKGGAGKDTVCEIAQKRYNAKNISAITPVKEIAKHCGWRGEKDNRARKFLSDLKLAMSEYNGLPNSYLEKEYAGFISGEDDLLFVHIRESAEIDDFKARVPTKLVTLIVRSERTDGADALYGNVSDDEVENYTYDYAFTNDGPIDELGRNFTQFLLGLLTTEGIFEL